MDSLFDNVRPKHVDSFQFQLVRYQESKNIEHCRKQDHSHLGRERKNMMQVPINLNELFDRRKVKPVGRIVHINKVLLIGNPGTGGKGEEAFSD